MEAITWSLWVVLLIWSVSGILNLMALFTEYLNTENINLFNLQLYIYIPAPLVLLDYLLG